MSGAAGEALRVRCPAKINLGLWVLGRRSDGYHDIDTIFQAVTLEDEIDLCRSDGRFSLETRGLPIPGPEPNLLQRAYELLAERSGQRAPGIAAVLTKRIPVGAGLGGGSSNAAGFLVAMSRILGLRDDPASLQDAAAHLGADVPFFLTGGTARGTERGDRVRQIGPIPPCWIVLATPSVAVSTGWAFDRIKNRLTDKQGDATMLAAAIVRGDWSAIVASLHNDFEDVVLPEVSVVGDLRRAFVARGASGSLLSGSGSTVFALTREREHALALAEEGKRLGAWVHVARPYECGVTVARLA
jgi:4-diphosphocytidyl-2-C-methyl-D-erythritol kinase